MLLLANTQYHVVRDVQDRSIQADEIQGQANVRAEFLALTNLTSITLQELLLSISRTKEIGNR